LRLECGYSEKDITPDGPTYLSRLGESTKSEGVHDRLYCRALSLYSRERFTLISCDLFALSSSTVKALKEKVATAISIKPSQVAIVTTGAGSTPLTTQMRGMPNPDESYMHFLEEAVLETAQESNSNLFHATASLSMSRVPNVTKNRVYQKKADDSIVSLRLKRQDGKRISLVNFASRPVLGPWNKEISADFFGHVCRLYEESGEECIYVNGATGDISPTCQPTFEEVAEMGKRVFERSRQEGKDIIPFVVSSELTVPLETRALSPDELRASEAEINKYLGSDEVERHTGLREGKLAEIELKWLAEAQKTAPSQIESTATALVLSPDFAIAGFSGELFSSIAELVKLGSPIPGTAVAGFANGYVGYIMSDQELGLSVFEATRAYRYFSALPLSTGSGKRVAKALLKAITEAAGKIDLERMP